MLDGETLGRVSLFCVTGDSSRYTPQSAVRSPFRSAS